MAIDNQFGKGIGVAAGFDLGAQKPLDARIAVNTIAERDAHVENNRAYEGMVVFVDETKKSYQLINGVWVELLKAEQDRLDALEAMLSGGEGVEGANGVLGALQDNIDAVQDNLDKAKTDLQKEIDDDVAAEAALRVAEEAKIREELANALKAAKEYADQKDTADKEAQSKFDATQNSRIDALEAANAEGGAVKKAIDQVAQDLADFEAAQATKEQAQDNKDAALQKAIEDEASRADAAEKANAKAISDEAAAARAAEQALAGRLDVIEGEAEGSIKKALADAKAYTDKKIEEVNGAAEDLEERVKANENALVIVNGEATVAGSIKKAQADAEAKAAELDDVLKTELQKEIDDDVKVEKQRAEEKEGELAQAIADEVARADAAEKANAAEMTKQKDANQEGTLANKIAANAAAIAQEVADRTAAVSAEAKLREDADKGLDDRLKAVEEMVGLESGEEGESLSDRVKANEDKLKGLEEGCDTVQAAIDKAEADAKKHADDAITALVDSAPDAMNTLNELAQAINANKGVYDAYVEQHATAMANMKTELQGEIDADVKVVVDAQKLVNDAQAETNEDFEGRIAANEAFVAAQPAIDQAQDNKIKALADAIGEGGTTKKAIEAAQAAAEAAQADVDAVEERLDKDGGLVDRLEAMEAFKNGHDHSAMEQGIAANKAAIEAEVGKDGVQGARDAAIAAALEAYSTTAEMKAILGNVVQSLNLSIVGDEVKLTLGSEADGIQLATAKLDLASDADITEIIEGLDAVEGE